MNEPKAYQAIMLSSTFTDLKEHRQRATKAIEKFGYRANVMEYDGARADANVIESSLKMVRDSAGYICVISLKYGQTPFDPDENPDRLSITELEFNEAMRLGRPIVLFVMDDEHLIKKADIESNPGKLEKLDAFRERAKRLGDRSEVERVYEMFETLDQFSTAAAIAVGRLVQDLNRHESNERSPAAIVAAQVGYSSRSLSNIPINVPRHFLGRREDLAAIDAALQGNKGLVAITALHGLRGVGKTTLAAAYAEKHAADYRATWWVRAETESTMRADLVGLGVRLIWVAADAQEELALAVVLERLRHDGEGVLLIYDNATNPGEVRKFLPRGTGSHIIITSNAPNWGGVAAPVEIEVWPSNIGADFLMARTGRKVERQGALALSEALGGLPLAHEQAAAYCERVGVSLAEYKKRFEIAPVSLLDDQDDASLEYHDGLTVAKTFALAIDEAAKRHPAAELLIVYAALLAPEPIPLYLFSEAREKFGEPLTSLLTADGLERAVATLRAFALIERESIPDERDTSIATDCIRLHRLVRQVTAARCKHEALPDLRKVLIKALAMVYPAGVFHDPKTWPRARRLDEIVLALVGGDTALYEGVEEFASYLLDGLASYRQSPLAAFGLSLPFLERALALDEKMLGPNHPDTATSLNNLGFALRVQGDFAGALSHYERALEIRTKALGLDHPETARSLNNLGYLLQEQGDLQGARLYFERALAIFEKTVGSDDPAAARCINNLGSLLMMQQDLVGARTLLERALAINERTRGLDHPDTATNLNNLAYLLRVQRNFAAALPLDERALIIRERILGPEHPSTQDTARAIDTSLTALGRRKEAKVLRKKYGISGRAAP